jgi:O-antigen ligase/tetratricopeptide (TPR) repeat protein
LIVARPLVPSEDPGLRESLPDPTGLVLTWLWLVALLGWAVWRFWVRPSGVRFDLLDGALLLLVGLNLLSTWFAARYKYAAWLMTWEWLAFFIAFYLVRRFAVGPGAGQGMLAAALATAVMLAAYAIYQYAVEIPGQAKLTRSELLAKVSADGFFYSPDDPILAQLEERSRSPNVYATFGHPNSFAGYLGLLLPAVLGWTVAARRANGWNARTILLAGCTALVVLALWWTHSRGAVLAAVLVAAGVVLWLARRLIAVRQLRALAGLIVLALGIGLLAFFGLREKNVGKVAPQASFALRLGYWNATWKMIGDHPWLGVGPGNFGRHYPAYMSETDYEEVQDPHNFALELWATCGFFGMAVLLVALSVFFRRVSGSRQQAAGSKEAGDSSLPAACCPLPATTPWEFYLGGMAGLILGFLLQAWYMSADEKIVAGATAGVRSLIWFPAFALFLSVPWSGRGRTLALTAGVAVLLLNLCVSGGIALSAVATSLWIIIALALPALPLRKAEQDAPRRAGQFDFLLRLLPVPICAALVMAYWGLFLQPTAQGARLARQALKAGNYFGQVVNAGRDDLVPEEWRREIRRNHVGFVRQQILRPLQVAAQANPEDARYPRWLADWTGVVWQMTRRDTDRQAAREYAHQTQVLDPFGRGGWLAEATLDAMFGSAFQLQSFYPILAASVPWGPFFNLQLPPQPLGAYVRIWQEPTKTRQAKAAQMEFDQAVKALETAVRLSPTQVYLRFQLAAGLEAAGYWKEAERLERELLKNDPKATHRSRKLTPQQREQIQRWLEGHTKN